MNNKLPRGKKISKKDDQNILYTIQQFFLTSNIQHGIQQSIDCCIVFVILLYKWCHDVTLRGIVILT